jgi:hypothetical protein
MGPNDRKVLNSRIRLESDGRNTTKQNSAVGSDR